MSLSNICILILYILKVINTQETETETESPTEDALLGKCPLGLFDFTFNSDTFNSLKLYLIKRNETDKFNVYSINKSISLLNDSEFDKRLFTVIYLNGFYEKPGINGITAPIIIDAYRHIGNFNILFLDTSSVIEISYFRGARAARVIGNKLANLLVQFVRSGFDIKRLDIIGHSTGAHVAGYTGKTYKKLTKKLLPRIIALDPSGPCFKKSESDQRLDKEDAQFVQVIHTGGISFGMLVPIGHMDFYVNGGRKQSLGNLLSCYLLCSHIRSVHIWKYALMYPKKFVGVECKTLEEVGEDSCYEKGRKIATLGAEANPELHGYFYIKTTDRPPFYTKLNI